MTQNHDMIAYQYVIENMIAALTDMKKILTVTEVATLEKTIEHMTNTIPNMRHIPAGSNLETMQKTIKNMTKNLPAMTENTVARDEQAIQKTIEEMVDVTTNMTDVLDIRNKEVLQKALKTLPPIIPIIIQMFSAVNWEKFEPSDEDIQIAQKVLNSKGIEQFIKEGFSEKNVNQELSNPFKTVLLVLMLLYSMMGFINDLTIMTVQEITHNQITPTVDSVMNAEQTPKRIEEKQTIKQLSDLLKEKIPTEIIHLFMIVEKNNLTVHQRMNENSKRIGTLDILDIVQVFERKEDWARVLCEHRKKEYLLEGWVLAKDLREIN